MSKHSGKRARTGGGRRGGGGGRRVHEAGAYEGDFDVSRGVVPDEEARVWLTLLAPEGSEDGDMGNLRISAGFGQKQVQNPGALGITPAGHRFLTLLVRYPFRSVDIRNRVKNVNGRVITATLLNGQYQDNTRTTGFRVLHGNGRLDPANEINHDPAFPDQGFFAGQVRPGVCFVDCSNDVGGVKLESILKARGLRVQVKRRNGTQVSGAKCVLVERL